MIDIAEFIWSHEKYRHSIPYFVFNTRRKDEMTFVVMDKAVKILPKPGVLQNKVILPVLVEQFFPVVDVLTGERLNSPFRGFNHWSLAQIKKMKEDESRIRR